MEGELSNSLRTAITNAVGETDKPIENRFEARRRAREAAEDAIAEGEKSQGEAVAEAAVESITRLELEELRTRISKKGIALTWDTKTPHLIAERSFSPLHGARLVRKQIETLVEYPIAETLIKHPSARRITLSVRRDAIVCAPRP